MFAQCSTWSKRLQRALDLPPRRSEASRMDQNLTALERAFQLAKAGQVTLVSDIIVTLKREGYPIDQVQGPQLLAQLRKLIEASHALKR